ncbi:MAG: folate family ECF transporter S component [Ruminococcus sp.]|nr:folate family ECF transporter S component [Candidatus Copronaster equi]
MQTKTKLATRTVAVLAMLVAFGVVLGRFVPVVNIWSTEIEFSFVAVMLAGYIAGPVGGVAVGGLIDFIGAILFPTGAYFPGFTATAALTGMVFGLMFHKNCSLWKIIVAVLSTQLVCSLILNTLFISILYTKAFSVLIVTRLIQVAIMSAVQIIIGFFMLTKIKSLEKLKF